MIEKSLPYEPGVRAPRFPIQVAEFDGRAAPRSVHAFLPKLVDACGLPSFEGLVAQVAKQALDCDHVTGFSFQIDEPASLHESGESVRHLRTYGDHAARMEVSRRSGLRSGLSVGVQM